MDPGRIVVLLLFILVSSTGIDGAILFNKRFDRSSSQVEKLDIRHARALLHRHRRDANTESGDSKILSNEVVLNGTEDHTQAYVHWSGKLKSEAMFILTLRYNGSKVADSQTWRSLDYGTTYHKLSFGKDALISFFYVSPVDHKKMVFTDVENQVLYTSSDEMKTNRSSPLPVASDGITMHPENSDWMLLYDYLQKKLYVTKDFGATWNVLQSDVNSRYFWGVKGCDAADIVHMEVQHQDSEQAFYKRCTIPDCKGKGDGIDFTLGPFLTQTMLLTYQYIFVQKSNLDGTDSHMMVSYNRSQFYHTYFPASVTTKDFLILDASEGQVFIAVNHGDRQGASLYLSDTSGRYYVLSLPRVHHRAISSWFDVDLHRVQGMNGTYLANQQMDSSSGRQVQIKSLISFDKGGRWQEIPSPRQNCPAGKGDDCALLLRLDIASYTQDWILSEDRAPGFLIAHGHYGRQYQHDLHNLSIFTSRDGGWNWTMAPMAGMHHFNILDQGSIVTAVQTGSQEVTNTVHYSCDEGMTWQQEDFGPRKLIVDGVLNEPGINTLVVSIYGHASTSSSWTMVKLNFSRVLPTKCTAKDYYTWMVADHDSTVNENCLLGQKVSYRRRNSTTCYNGENFVRNIANESCTCIAEDFECDFGFRQQGADCVQESWYNNGSVARDCTEGQTYKQSKGYRKVGSDKCVGGVSSQSRYQQTDQQCPLVAPSALMLMANLTMVATGRPVHFHLSQKQGSVNSTQYVWHFNGSQTVNMTGLIKAQQQTHRFTKAGTYDVFVYASNSKGHNQSNNVTVTVQDSVHTLAIFQPGVAKVGFPVPVSVTSNLWQPGVRSSLHFLFRFGDQGRQEQGVLTWKSNLSHTYNKSGNFVLSVSAINSVSAATRQVTIKVIDDGIMVQLVFSPNVDRVAEHMALSAERVFALLESARQELARMLALNLDRLGVSLNSTHPVRVDMLVLPPPSPPPPSSPSQPPEPSPKEIVQTIKDKVGNGSMILFRSSGLRRSIGEIRVIKVIVLNSEDGGDKGGESGANYHPLYIAIPILLLAALVTGLVLVYYRRRFRNIRRYSMVNQDEDTDALLDEEDEPPLDLRAETRETARSRDDAMLDLGTGSHLVMVTGAGGGDGAENC